MYYLNRSVGDMEILDRFQQMTMKMIKTLSISPLRKVYLRLFRLEKRRLWEILSMHKRMEGRCTEDCQVLPSDRTRDNGHKLKLSALVSFELELIFFLVSVTVLCFESRMRIILTSV